MIYIHMFHFIASADILWYGYDSEEDDDDEEKVDVDVDNDEGVTDRVARNCHCRTFA